jgi:hypothetical protein
MSATIFDTPLDVRVRQTMAYEKALRDADALYKKARAEAADANAKRLAQDEASRAKDLELREWAHARLDKSHKATPPADAVNHPTHYAAGDIECIDAIRAALTPDEFRGFCKGNVIKYAWRERLKGGVESLRKAAWYLARIAQ